MFITLHDSLRFLALLISILLYYVMACGKGSGAWESRQVIGTILVLTAIPHMEFVGAGPLYLYHAYWCAMAILLLALQLPLVVPRWPSPPSLATWTAPKHLACAALTGLFLFLLAMKGGRVLWSLPQCTTDVYEQQYQIRLFVRQYHQNSTVALNDIGAVNFPAHIHCLDLWGLASREVAAAKRNHTFQRATSSVFPNQPGPASPSFTMGGSPADCRPNGFGLADGRFGTTLSSGETPYRSTP